MAAPRKKSPKPKPAAESPPAHGHAPPPRHGTAAPLLSITFKVAVAASLIVGVVYGVARLGESAGRQVAPRDRYTVAFTDLQVEPPPGLDRVTFLSEAQHLGHAGATLQAVDPNLAATLTAVFAKHPWVAEVVGVSVGPDAAVTVTLKYRVPVLAVTVAGEDDLRAVDRSATLLPLVPPPRDDLPRLVTARPAPAVNAGEVWPDEVVRRATDLALTYKPRTIEKTAKNWRLTQRGDVPALIVGY